MQRIIRNELVNGKNNISYATQVLSLLMTDFVMQQYPENHFWHNRKRILDSFRDCDAIVALNDEDNIVGFMTWISHDDLRYEIDIVEVKKEYRRQGIFKKMIEDFLVKCDEACILTAHVLSQAHEAFGNLGWKKVHESNDDKKSQNNNVYFNLIKPGLGYQPVLPDGPVIAVCSADYYQVINNRSDYIDKIQYFNITLDTSWKLSQPIIVPGFNCEYYLGIYYNKKLIIEGKGKHLFESDPCHRDADMLIIDQLHPLLSNREVFLRSGFLPEVSVLNESMKQPARISEQQSVLFKNKALLSREKEFLTHEVPKKENQPGKGIK